MAKGFFTQSAMVLFESIPSLDELTQALSRFEVLKVNPEPGPQWMGGPSLLLPLRPEVNGCVLVDLVDEVWPDAMGDPQTDVDLFGAWSLGHFGPFVYPQNLARARAMSVHWPEASAETSRHTGFVRIRTSYILGADDSARLAPEDYAPLPELDLVTQMARELLDNPRAVAYFNPNGETLHSRTTMDEALAWHARHDLPPLPIWSHVRLFQLESPWLLMDTVGMQQLDVIDHEACFRSESYNPGEVAAFLRNAADYVFDHGPIIEPGDTMDGPGGIRWQAQPREESLAPQPRSVLRWTPMDGSRPPA